MSGASRIVTFAYPVASILALLTLWGLEHWNALRAETAEYWTLAVALVTFLGALHGFAWSLAASAIAHLPRRWANAVWLLAGALVPVWLVHRLGVLARLQGPTAELAVITLGSCALAGLAMGGLLAALHAGQPGRYSPLANRTTRLVWSAGVTLLAAASGEADRRLMVGLYPELHLALRCSCWCLAMFAWRVALHRPERDTASSGRVLGMLAVTLALTYLLSVRPAAATLQELSLRTWPAQTLTWTRAVFDVDRDGYSGRLGGGDCAEWNSHIHPNAPEIPGNGIDDNCVLGDAAPANPLWQEPSLPTAASPLDVVLVTIDSLRPDHLGVYDAAHALPAHATSPCLDAWSRGARVFLHAYTPGAWTAIALASVMHGVYPRRLGWVRYYETNQGRALRRASMSELKAGESVMRLFPMAEGDPRQLPLAAWLQRRGMLTAAVVDDGFSEAISSDLSVLHGFSEIHQIDDLPVERRNDQGTADVALDTLERLSHGPPFFLWAHFFGPHAPNTLHSGVPRFGDSAQDRYDHEIAFTDSQLCRILTRLSQLGRPHTIIITADHGEAFLGDVRGHGTTLDEAIIRVPLLVRGPGFDPGPVERTVNLVDLLPTVLELTATPAPAWLDGRSLMQADAQSGGERVLYSDTWFYDLDSRATLDQVAAYDGTRKVVHDRHDQSFTQVDQSGPDASLVRRPVATSDVLVQSIRRYLEQSGGALRLAD
jgi:arylsulfatase A-like enzyme